MKEYYDAESFRAAVEEEQLDSDLRALLPRPDGKPIEKPAEAALRQRMCAPHPPVLLAFPPHPVVTLRHMGSICFPFTA